MAHVRSSSRIPGEGTALAGGRPPDAGRQGAWRMARVLVYLWTAPNTLLGLLGAALALRGGRIHLVAGVVEAHGPALKRTLALARPFGGEIAAITFGHVVLAGDPESLESTRRHERVHVAQYERWGPLFIPAYLAAGAWAAARGRHPYFDNPFERAAYRPS